ncbi:uncharacterized protein LOC142985267 [Anticarsia gemmatalis]|uniref:uncharacterized protein LOC142985267 n=1 Tax=Anticarsia gemmatalis TaxID=129554 RepID=UPI003F7664D3
MPAPRKISGRQLELLIHFMEAHPTVALGRFTGGSVGSQAARQTWQELELKLNSVPEGAIKSSEQWRRYWIELKAKVKAKAADSRRSTLSTGGGGGSKLVPLTLYEKRIVALVRKWAGQGLPGVRRRQTNVRQIKESSQETSPQSGSLAEITLLEPIICVDVEKAAVDTSPPSEDDRTSPTGGPGAGLLEGNGEESPSTTSLDAGEVRTSTTASTVSTVHDRQSPNRTNPHPATSNARSSRYVRRLRPNWRDERVPRSAFDLESRRLDLEERHATALETIASVLQNMERNQTVFLQRITAALEKK